MEMNDASDQTTAGAFARLLEETPMPLKSLKLDHATLVARLETLMPSIETFARCTCELLLTGNRDEAYEGIEAYSARFAEGLDISLEDGRFLCIQLVMLAFLFRQMGPVLETMEKDRNWQEWLGRAWGKEK